MSENNATLENTPEVIVDIYKSVYTKGTRVELIEVKEPSDEYAPYIGCRGTVKEVTVDGRILIDWDNGSHYDLVWDKAIIKVIMSSKDRMQFREEREPSVNKAISYMQSIWGDYGQHEQNTHILLDYIESLEKKIKDLEYYIK